MKPPLSEREKFIIRKRAARALNTVLSRRTDHLGEVRVVEPVEPTPPRKEGR